MVDTNGVTESDDNFVVPSQVWDGKIIENGTTIVLLNSGKVITGVKTTETPEAITLGDKDGKLQVIPRSEIEELRVDPLSTMPAGLEQQMTDSELTDLIEFLVSQKHLTFRA